MNDVLNDWNIKPDAETLAYHQRQAEPYRSTVAFGKFIEPWAKRSRFIMDIGCGAGNPTSYLAAQSGAYFCGIDSSDALILEAMKSHGKTIAFHVGDACNLKPKSGVDGVVSLAMLSWMPDYKVPLDEIASKIKPEWIAFSSLFYAGDISCRIVVEEPKRPRKSFHNIYSVPQVREFMKVRGYRLAAVQKFEIDQTLPPPHNVDIMKSWTVETEFGRMIKSGPLFLPWHFLCFERTR